MSHHPPRLVSAKRSERGVRPTNEDEVLSTALPDGRWLAALADGMGGLHDGDTASRTALDALRRGLEEGRTLPAAVEEANRAVLRNGRGRPTGTTLVAALFDEDGVRIANVGDSRAYLLGPVGLVQVTRDHTFAAEAADQEDPAARSVASSRWGGTLTRSLGSSETVEVDQFGPLALEGGLRLLLCSDGVHGILSDEEMERCLGDARSPEAAVERLVDLALERGGQDNLSAVVVEPVSPEGPTEDPGTVRPGHGVPEPGGTPVTKPSRDTPRAEARRPGASAPWDPARLVRRAPRRRRRKPGTLQTVLVILALVGLVLLMMVFLP